MEGCTIDHLTIVLVYALNIEGGFSDVFIAKKLIFFAANGVSIFQGKKKGATLQLTRKYAPYMFGVHCMAHHTNLAVGDALTNFPIVTKIEDLV